MNRSVMIFANFNSFTLHAKLALSTYNLILRWNGNYAHEYIAPTSEFKSYNSNYTTQSKLGVNFHDQLRHKLKVEI